MQLDNADATEYRFLHEMQPNRRMRENGGKKPPPDQSLHTTSKMQGSDFIGKNLNGTIVSRHHMLLCSNTLLLQCSYARLLVWLSVNTLSHSSDFKKKRKWHKSGPFRCGWMFLGLMLRLIPFKITFFIPWLSFCLLFLIKTQPPCFVCLFVVLFSRLFPWFFFFFSFLFFGLSAPETIVTPPSDEGEIGLSKKKKAGWAGETWQTRVCCCNAVLLLCCKWNLVGWLVCSRISYCTSRKDKKERKRGKQRIQACMVAVHAALCGLSHVYTCPKHDSYHARKTETDQEKSIQIMQCSASYMTVE